MADTDNSRINAEDQKSVGKPVASLHAEPDPEAEQVNQALLNTPAMVLERHTGSDGAEWARVDLPDYSGWMRVADLADEPGIHPDTAAGRVVRVVVPRANIETVSGPLTVFAGTLLRLGGGSGVGTMEVLLPGGGRGLVDAAQVRSVETPGAEERDTTIAGILAIAHEYVGTPYVWGGLTREGIDCSGFTQTIYRVHGYTIPRDADEQFNSLTEHVEHGEWQPGDLLYLGPAPTRITHVGMYVGDGKVIHACRPHLVVQSMDANSENGTARFTDEYQGARRVIG